VGRSRVDGGTGLGPSAVDPAGPTFILVSKLVPDNVVRWRADGPLPGSRERVERDDEEEGPGHTAGSVMERVLGLGRSGSERSLDFI